MMQEDRAQYLLLIVDVNPLLWMSKPFTPNGRSAFFDFIDQLFMFINAFSLLNRENKIAVIATHPDQNEMVFSEFIPSDLDDPVASAVDDPLLSLNTFTRAHSAAATVRQKLIHYATSMTPSLEEYVAKKASKKSTDHNDEIKADPSNRLGTGFKSKSIDPEIEYPPSLVAGAVSMALCYFRRLLRLQNTPSSQFPATMDLRILILQASNDDPRQYVSMMNAIFSSLQLHIPLNSVMLVSELCSTPANLDSSQVKSLETNVKSGSGSESEAESGSPSSTSTSTSTPVEEASSMDGSFLKESVFLQQAGYITGAIYSKVVIVPASVSGDVTDNTKPSFSRNPLLQHLFMTYLPDSNSSKVLLLPKRGDVDLRAACHCHDRVVDEGVFCPVCLAVYCTPQPECSLCQSTFPYVRSRVLVPSRPTSSRQLLPPGPGLRTKTKTDGSPTNSVTTSAAVSVPAKRTLIPIQRQAILSTTVTSPPASTGESDTPPPLDPFNSTNSSENV